MKTYLIFSSILILFGSFKPKAKDVLYPQATIILLPGKSNYLEEQGAVEIRKALLKIYKTNTGFDIQHESAQKQVQGKFIISLGKTKYKLLITDGLPPYSFSITKRSNIISITGVDEMGTLLGAEYFLDHYCNVRSYLPAELFTHIPESNKITLDKEFTATQSPSVKYVFSTGLKGAESYWARMHGLVRKNWGSHQHSMGDRFFNDSIINNFPEIFPLIEGKRYFPVTRTDQKWQPDLAEPKLIDAAVYSSIQYFKANPTIDYISFSVQDSRIFSKEGKLGKYLQSFPPTPVGQRRGYTQANAAFLNGLAKQLRIALKANGIAKPKTIVYIAYSQVNRIPEIKLDSSILPIIVFQVAETLMDSVYQEGPDGLKNYRLSEWAKVTSRIGNHDWAEGKGFIYPRIYTNLVSKFARTIIKDKMTFEYAHIEAYPNWGLDGPKLYFMGKIYWNAYVNTDSLLTLFCSDMFRRAKKEMKNYFVTLEELNTCMNNDATRNRRLGAYTTQLPLNENELHLLAQARSNLYAAKNKARDENEKKRIDFFERGFKLSELFFDLYNSKNNIASRGQTLKLYLQNKVAGDSMILNEATDPNFLKRTNTIIDNIVKQRTRTSK